MKVEKEAATTVKKDMLTQKEALNQRLAERKRSRVARVSSMGRDSNQTLNLSSLDEPATNNSIDLVSVTQPVVGRSSLMKPPPLKHASSETVSPVKRQRPITVNPAGNSFDDALSAGRSTTTVGGSLANKIGTCISRILSNKNSLDMDTTEDDVTDLFALIRELNSHHDLAVKLSSTSKISKILLQVDEPTDKRKDIMAEIKGAKQVRLGAFQSKLRLEMKSMTIDPRVREIMDNCRAQLEEL